MHTTATPNIAPAADRQRGTLPVPARMARLLIARHGFLPALARAEARMNRYVQDPDGVRYVTHPERWLYWRQVARSVARTPQPSALAQAIAQLRAEDADRAHHVHLTFLEEVDEGRLAANATDELAVLVREIHALSRIEGLKPKGKLRIEITVQSNKTVMDVIGEVKTVMPRRPRSGSSFFRTRDNQLSAVNPAQLGIEFRDVQDVPAIVRKV